MDSGGSERRQLELADLTNQSRTGVLSDRLNFVLVSTRRSNQRKFYSAQEMKNSSGEIFHFQQAANNSLYYAAQWAKSESNPELSLLVEAQDHTIRAVTRVCIVVTTERIARGDG